MPSLRLRLKRGNERKMSRSDEINVKIVIQESFVPKSGREHLS
jgi:hypothetical protein